MKPKLDVRVPRWPLTIPAAILASGAVACAEYPLVPQPGAPGAEKGRVISRAENVEVTAAVTDWPDTNQVFRHVTPINVTIRNEGDEDLRVRYDDFQLVSAGGVTYRALRPNEIEGAVDVRVAPPWPRWNDDWYAYRDSFYAGPYTVPLHGPGTIYYDGFAYDPYYYNTYPSYWVTVPLPTPTMQAIMMPEGTLAPGSIVSGWLYFEPVPADDLPPEQVDLVFDLVSADSGAELGAIDLSFVTED